MLISNVIFKYVKYLGFTPPHKLDIKIGLPIICLRNINPNEGLCNGTRLKILAISNRIIQAEITIGQFKGLKLFNKIYKIFKILWIILWIKDKKVFIPRMPLIPSDTGLPFDFKRIQFPIRPAYCITINKAQGQTLDFVSIWLGIIHFILNYSIIKIYLK